MKAPGEPSHEPAASLHGVRILTTRPANQSGGILRKLRARGAEVRNFPTIEIVERTDADALLAKIAGNIAGYDLAIFISANAVEYGFAALKRAKVAHTSLPPVVAIGRTTAGLLRLQGVADVTWPPEPSSASLLRMPAVRGLGPSSRALLFRGVGGKELIADGLRTRGIEVRYAEVYERRRPTALKLSFTDFCPDLILVTSRDGLRNLHAMVEDKARDRLLRTPVLLGSRSMLDLHEKLGFRQRAEVAASPLDDDMTAATLAWNRQ